MNYIQQLRAFDDFKLYDTKLSVGQNALWYALMSINNKSNWKTWFTVANSTLENLSGLSRSGIAKDRNILRQLGLIDFKSNGRKATSYRVCVLYTSNSAQDSVQDSTQGSVQDSTQGSVQGSVQDSSTLIKLNKTETKQEDDDGRARVLDLWQNLWGFPNAIARQDLDEWMTSLSPDLVQYAIEVAGHHDVQARAADKYVGKVVQGWLDLKITTLKAAQQANTEHEQRLSNARGSRPRGQITETLPAWADDTKTTPKSQPSVTDEQQAAVIARLEKIKHEKQQEGSV
ncbi:DnaD domain protein [Secundilactobacillus paracollinoides]|uniref:DnaD domain protein n=1 Tax=Secundilactobacillus paracollinoides TaxID=240427 RepID=UPI003F479976